MWESPEKHRFYGRRCRGSEYELLLTENSPCYDQMSPGSKLWLYDRSYKCDQNFQLNGLDPVLLYNPFGDRNNNPSEVPDIDYFYGKAYNLLLNELRLERKQFSNDHMSTASSHWTYDKLYNCDRIPRQRGLGPPRW